MTLTQAMVPLMTRINCVPPQELSTRHLIAEYRELPRVFTLARNAIARGERPTDPRNPSHYVLGKGHVRFFYPRLGYLQRRQADIITECLARSFKLTFTETARLTEGIPEAWRGDWVPGAAALALNRARIAERSSAAGPGAELMGVSLETASHQKP